MSSNAWMGSFVENAVDFLSQHFGVSSPRVVLNCEETCRWAGKCHYVACYMPWLNQVNFKSGSEKGIIVSHEFGHRLQKAGILEEGEVPAILMEEWWAENVNELSCEVCGSPLFVSEDTVPGTEVECESCHSVYEAVQIHGQVGGEVVISKGALASATIALPIAGTVFSGFVFDTLPKGGLTIEENIRRTRQTVGGVAVAGFLGALGFLAVKS